MKKNTTLGLMTLLLELKGWLVFSYLQVSHSRGESIKKKLHLFVIIAIGPVPSNMYRPLRSV